MNSMDHFANVSDLECECIGWCRSSITPFTNHHPNCPKYNDSLIDVWVVFEEGKNGGYYDSSKDGAFEVYSEGVHYGQNLKIRVEKLHKEIYDNLPEFDGF